LRTLSSTKALALFDFEALPEVVDVDGSKLEVTSALTPFPVPFLEDKPQNPIIQRLQVRTTGSRVQSRHPQPKEILVLSEQLEDGISGVGDAHLGGSRLVGMFKRGRVASWDTFSKNDSVYAYEDDPTSFLSEQPVYAVSAARFCMVCLFRSAH